MLNLFLTFELGKFVKYFTTKRSAKIITTSLFMLVFLFVGIGIYSFFVSGFMSINVGAEEDIRLALSLFLYELFLLVLSGLIIFSATVSIVFNLFRGDKNTWLLSSPSYSILPKIIFIRSLFASSLPLFVMFLPAVLALNKVYTLGAVAFATIMFSVFIVLLTLNSLTFFIVLFFSYIYYKLSKKIKVLKFSFGGLVGIILVVLSGLVFFVWKVMTRVDLISLFKSNEVSPQVSVASMADHFIYIPTHPFAMEIIHWQMREQREAFSYLGILIVLGIVSLVLTRITRPFFYPLWQRFQEGSAGTKTVQGDKTLQQKTAYLFTGSKIVALFKKETLISSRNLKGVLWFSFLLCIWLMQIGANFILDHNIQRHEHDITSKIITLQLIQYIIAIYFISSFTLRFAFPSFSTEKKTAWILGSAPTSFRRIFFGKYLFYSSFFVVVGILMNYVNSFVLNVPFSHALYSMMLFIAVIICIVTLGLSIGALFPSSETDDPEAITTSMPGLFFTALALLYGALSDFVLYLTLTEGRIGLIISFIIGTYALTIYMLYQTPRIIQTRVV